MVYRSNHSQWTLSKDPEDNACTDCILQHNSEQLTTFDFSICMIQNRKRTHEISLAKFQALPETGSLPIVFLFAECISSDTRQTNSLSSAAKKTLSKATDSGSEVSY